MVVLQARELHADIPDLPPLPLLDNRSRGPRRRRRNRTNPRSVLDSPTGFLRCRTPGCTRFIPSSELLKDVAYCSAGHELDVRQEHWRDLETPGGYSLCGLSNKEQGDIAERVIQELRFLGEFGEVVEWYGGNHPYDGMTNLGWAVEVKSVNAELARNHAFTRSTARATERKHAEMERCNATGLVGALVPLYYSTSEAWIYLRGMQQMTYFEKPKTRPFEVFNFEHFNPFAKVEEQRELDFKGDDIPF